MAELNAGLIGANIQRTRLPFALDALCQIYGLDFSFELIDTALLADFDFRKCVQERMDRKWTGVTVTHPYKTEAADLVGHLTGAPSHMGASNTLIFNGGTEFSDLTAFNTDYSGFVGAWQAEFGEEKPGRVVMAGAGGVSRAIAVALIELGAEQLVIWDLKPENARDVAGVADPSGTRAIAVPIEQADAYIKKADGMVNATALGMLQYPGMAFDKSMIGTQTWAFDAVYTPIWTEFMETARSRGLTCLTGFSLFKHMAMRTFQTYTGRTVDQQQADQVIDPLVEGL